MNFKERFLYLTIFCCLLAHLEAVSHTPSMTIRPTAPTDTWNGVLESADSAVLTVNVINSENVGGLTYTLSGSPGVSITPPTGAVLWTGTMSGTTGTFNLVNTTQVPASTMVAVSCIWRPSTLISGGGGGGIPANINGLARGIATLKEEKVVWSFTPTQQLADGRQLMLWNAAITDSSGNAIPITYGAATPVSLNPSTAVWSMTQGTPGNAGTLKSSDASVGEMRLRYFVLTSAHVSTSANDVTFYKIRIKQDGVDITDTTHNEVVGKKINLSAEIIPSSVTMVSPQWTVPGKRIKNYEADASRGTVTDIAAADLQANSTFFYWVDGDDGRNVRFNCQVAGQPIQTKATFDVKRPETEIQTYTGSIAVNGLYVEPGPWLHFGDNFRAGAEFHYFLNNSFGFNGDFQYVQIVDNLKTVVTHNSGSKHNISVDDVLDREYPVPLVSPFIANDSPGVRLADNLINAKTDMNFTMYLMFKPNVPDAIWVPLRKVKWYWKAEAKFDSVTLEWSLSSNPNNHSNNPSDTNATRHPEWNDNMNNHLQYSPPVPNP